MEKEKDGLFGRLVLFWKEKIRMQGEDGIGFWKEADDMGNHFAEMGAVAALSQKETRGVFWQEEAERKVLEKKVVQLLPEVEESYGRKENLTEDEKREEKTKYSSKIFAAERFAAENITETDGNGLRSTFLKNMLDEDIEERPIIPVFEENNVMQEREQNADVLQREDNTGNFQKEEKPAESKLDVEQVMREITKRLWEEREGCGRRLR